MPFLEDPVFPDDISYGSKGGPMFNTSVAIVNSGYETRNANWLYPLHKFNIRYGIKTSEQMYGAREHFYVVRGMADGFRYKDWHDYTSGVNNASATAFDCSVTASAVISTSSYQLYKQYVKGARSFTRKISKPLASTVVVAVSSVLYPSSQVSVLASTGTINFATDVSAIVSAITQAVSSVFTITGHSYLTGETLYIDNALGMTEINGKRITITSTTANTLETDHDTSGYGAYTSSASANTHPQNGEVIQAGFEFDVPVRFNSDIFDTIHDDYDITTTDIEVVEIRI